MSAEAAPDTKPEGLVCSECDRHECRCNIEASVDLVCPECGEDDCACNVGVLLVSACAYRDGTLGDDCRECDYGIRMLERAGTAR